MTRKTRGTAKELEGIVDNEFFILLTTNLTNDTKDAEDSKKDGRECRQRILFIINNEFDE